MPNRYEWNVTESPKIAQLTGVESHDGVAYASGKRGILIEKRTGGNWRGVTLEGPTSNGHNLNDVAITADGNRVWYCGDSGSFGYYDRVRDTIEAHPGPSDHTDGFRSVSVVGDAGSEVVYTASDTGRVVQAAVDGTTVTVKHSAVPTDGTTFTDVVADNGDLFLADVSGEILYSTDGREWTTQRLTKSTVEGLALAETGVAAVTDDGVAYRDIDLFEVPNRMKRADGIASDPEDITAAGERFVVVGGDGAVVPVDSQGRVSEVDPGPGITFYSADLRADGTLLAVGSGGTIVEGTPTA